MRKLPFLKRVIDFVAEQSTSNTANVLILATAGGWLLSSAAQIMGIYFNKNYTKKEKSFMIPQEMADAFVNIGSFLLVTKSLKSLTTKMVETGKLAPKSICEFLKEKGLSSLRGNFDFNLTAVEGFSKHKNTYDKFKTAAEATAAIVGGVLSSNIITPILRNKIAANRKERMLATLGGDTDTQAPKPVTTTTNTGTIYPKRHTFDDFRTISTNPTTQPTNVENTRAKQTFDAFRAQTMKI